MGQVGLSEEDLRLAEVDWGKVSQKIGDLFRDPTYERRKRLLNKAILYHLLSPEATSMIRHAKSWDEIDRAFGDDGWRELEDAVTHPESSVQVGLPADDPDEFEVVPDETWSEPEPAAAGAMAPAGAPSDEPERWWERDELDPKKLYVPPEPDWEYYQSKLRSAEESEDERERMARLHARASAEDEKMTARAEKERERKRRESDRAAERARREAEKREERYEKDKRRLAKMVAAGDKKAHDEWIKIQKAHARALKQDALRDKRIAREKDRSASFDVDDETKYGEPVSQEFKDMQAAGADPFELAAQFEADKASRKLRAARLLVKYNNVDVTGIPRDQLTRGVVVHTDKKDPYVRYSYKGARYPWRIFWVKNTGEFKRARKEGISDKEASHRTAKKNPLPAPVSPGESEELELKDEPTRSPFSDPNKSREERARAEAAALDAEKKLHPEKFRLSSKPSNVDKLKAAKARADAKKSAQTTAPVPNEPTSDLELKDEPGLEAPLEWGAASQDPLAAKDQEQQNRDAVHAIGAHRSGGSDRVADSATEDDEEEP